MMNNGDNGIDIIDKVEDICGRMPEESDLFIDLMLDYGFKHVFGMDEGKALMIGLLRVVLPEKDIVDLSFIQNQSLNFGSDTKRSVYDVQCKLKDGSRIIVEVQRCEQTDFKDRVLYYGTMPISTQTKKGSEYKLIPVYVIAFVNFNLQHGNNWKPKIVSTYKLLEEGGDDIMSENLTFIYVELRRFNKLAYDCRTFDEKLYFCMKHMHELKGRPRWFNEPFFETLFERSAVAKLKGEQLTEYYRAMTTERDIKNMIIFAERKGRAEGLAEGLAEVARAMMAEKMDVALIARCTGLTVEQIQAL